MAADIFRLRISSGRTAQAPPIGIAGTGRPDAHSVAMRFYIHVKNGVGYLADDEGDDFVDQAAAERAAIHAGADIIADEIRAGAQSVELTLYIEDADHIQVAELPVKASISLGRQR
jgi:hypothetical protein